MSGIRQGREFTALGTLRDAERQVMANVRAKLIEVVTTVEHQMFEGTALSEHYSCQGYITLLDRGSIEEGQYILVLADGREGVFTIFPASVPRLYSVSGEGLQVPAP